MRDPLSHKMNQWEASPPPGAWEVISREMNEWNAEKRVSGKLENWEAAPPSGTWSAIAEQIADPALKPAFQRGDVPVRTLFPYLIRYGAAAAIIGVIAWVLWSSPFQGADEMATSTIPLTTNKQETSTATPDPSNAVAAPAGPEYAEITDQNQQENFVRAGKTRYPREPEYARVKSNRQPMELSASNWQQQLVSQFLNPALKKLPVQQTDTRYIRIASNNGNPIRLSAKYAPVYHQLTYSRDNANRLYSIEQQLLKSSYIPDPGNLFDILQLKELLEEQ